MTEPHSNNDATEALEEGAEPTGISGESHVPLPKIDFPMGGQAVIEGVMMRGPESYAVAVRRPQGDIRITSKRFFPVSSRKRWLKLPIVRGAASLIELLLLGYRSLEYSANVYEEGCREIERQEAGQADGEEQPAQESKALGGWAMAGIFAVSMGFAMLLFVALPNVITHGLGLLAGGGESGRFAEINSPILYNLAAGAVRVAVIVGYVWAISLMKDIRRLFQYHGAEHKVIMTYESELPLTLEHIRRATKRHPRCGTTFIAIVLLVSIAIFAVLAALIVRLYPPFAEWSVWLRKPVLIAMHILFMPLVGGLAYEITRRAGRNPGRPLYRILLAPGYAFQRITTREPDDSMIEVALRSFRTALAPALGDDGMTAPSNAPREQAAS